MSHVFLRKSIGTCNVYCYGNKQKKASSAGLFLMSSTTFFHEFVHDFPFLI